jgi:hypothetical protein
MYVSLRIIYIYLIMTEGRAMAQAVSRRSLTVQGPGSIPGQSMWDLWWTKWHWDRFCPEYFGFSLSIAFHRCSVKIDKIFITGLHNNP